MTDVQDIKKEQKMERKWYIFDRIECTNVCTCVFVSVQELNTCIQSLVQDGIHVSLHTHPSAQVKITQLLCPVSITNKTYIEEE